MALSSSTGLRAALALGLLVAAPAGATTMVPLTHAQLVDASDAIVRGHVVEVWVEQDRAGAVWTRAQIAVDEVLKGSDGLSVIVVDQQGGTYGAASTRVDGVARFSVGEDALLFLETLPSGHTVPVGMMQGKFTVRLDPYSRDLLAQRFTVASDRAYDHRFIPLPAADERLALSDFEAEIRDRVAAGWDGQPIPGADPDRLRRATRTQTEGK